MGYLQVLNSSKISEGKSNIIECLVGDSTGCILLTAKGTVCSMLEAGACVHIVNAKTDMYKGSMRLQAFTGDAQVEETDDAIDVKVRFSVLQSAVTVRSLLTPVTRGLGEHSQWTVRLDRMCALRCTEA